MGKHSGMAFCFKMLACLLTWGNCSCLRKAEMIKIGLVFQSLGTGLTDKFLVLR